MSMKNERPPPFASACSGSGEPAEAPLAHSFRRSTSDRSIAVPMAPKDFCLSSCVSFSAPTASATSTDPEATADTARWKAVDADAQAFSTLTKGTPSRPVWRSAAWPRIISWPVRMPATAFEKNTISTSPAVSPASASASATAPSASERTVLSGNLPNRVIAAPTMSTSGIVASAPAGADPVAVALEHLHEEAPLHLRRRGQRHLDDGLDDVGHVRRFEPSAAVLEQPVDVEVLGVIDDDGGDDVGLAGCAGAGRDPIDVNVLHLGVFGDRPADEALGDELAHLAEAALLFAVLEEHPAVRVARGDVAGVQPAVADLLRRGLRILVVGELGCGADRPRDQLPAAVRWRGAAVLVDNVHLEDVPGRLAERADWPEADRVVGETALHRPVPLEHAHAV